MKIFGIIIGSLIVLTLGLGLWFNQIVSAGPDDSTKPYTLTIKAGSGVKAVAEDLFQAGYISQRWHWNIYVFMSGLRSGLLPGTYALKPDMSIREIASLVSTPPSGPQEVEVKLLEGWTASDMADVLDRAGVVKRQDFLDATAVTDSRSVVDKAYSFLADKPATANLEGYLFPDTYRFFVDSTPDEVLQKLLDNFEIKLSAGLRSNIQNSGRSIFETITLASILERELRQPRDMALAADLYLRRIEAGVALQADATVLYALGTHKTTITSEDLQFDSPYNTYLYRGLPPGPIGNPGLNALRAASHPEPNSYFYYLSAPNGQTIWASTLDEHNQNKAKYLR